MCPTGSALQITRRDCRPHWTISPLTLNAERRLPRSHGARRYGDHPCRCDGRSDLRSPGAATRDYTGPHRDPLTGLRARSPTDAGVPAVFARRSLRTSCDSPGGWVAASAPARFRESARPTATIYHLDEPPADSRGYVFITCPRYYENHLQSRRFSSSQARTRPNPLSQFCPILFVALATNLGQARGTAAWAPPSGRILKCAVDELRLQVSSVDEVWLAG
jgi:hypothetical protein